MDDLFRRNICAEAKATAFGFHAATISVNHWASHPPIVYFGVYFSAGNGLCGYLALQNFKIHPAHNAIK
jgi:hypothetical protein